MAMAMEGVEESGEESAEQRKVTFLVWSGHYPVNKMSVKLYTKEKHIDMPSNHCRIIDCTTSDVGTGKIWKAETHVANEHIWYTYAVDDFPSDDTTDSDHGGYVGQEKLYRELPSEISYCHDILRLQQSLDDDDLLQGFFRHLELLLSRADDKYNIQAVLQEFEHLLGKEERVFAQEKQLLYLQKYLTSSFKDHSDSMAKLLLLAVSYGILLKHYSGDTEASSGLDLDKSHLINIRDAIIVGKDVTPRSFTHLLLETGKEALKGLKQYNWLWVVTYFPHLFMDVEQILLFKDQMGSDVDSVPFDQVLAIIVPLIMSHFQELPESSMNAILVQIPSTPGFKHSEDELQELHREIDRHKVAISSREEVQPDTAAPAREEPQLDIQQHAAADSVQREMVEHIEIQTTGSQNMQSEITCTFRLMACLKGCIRVKPSTIIYRYCNAHGERSSNDCLSYINFKIPRLESSFISGKDPWYYGKVHFPVPINMINATIQYKYSISYQTQGKIRKFPSDRNITEKQWRFAVPPQELFDVLDDPSDPRQRLPISCLGRFMHVYQRLSAVRDTDLKSSLLTISEIGFGEEITEEFKSLFIGWMNQTFDTSIEKALLNSQIIYVTILFGIVMKSGNTCIDHNSLSHHALDKILRALHKCKQIDIPSDMLRKEVKDVCIWLTYSLGHSWLFLWSSFYHLFEVEDLLECRPCRHYGPLFSTTNLSNDMGYLASTLMTFVDDKPGYFRACTIFAIKNIGNLEVLVEVFKTVISQELFRSHINDASIESELTTKLKDLVALAFATLSRNVTSNLLRMWHIVGETQLSTVTAEVRQQIISYLSEKKWSASSDQIRSLLLDRKLFEKRLDFICVMKNMLNETTTNLKPQEAFIDVVSKQPIIQDLNIGELRDLVERAIHSYTSALRVHSTQQAIQSAFRLQDHIKRHFSDKESILKKTQDGIYKLMKNVPLVRLFESLMTPNSNWTKPELQLLTGHISRRLRDAKEDIKSHMDAFATQLDTSGTNRYELTEYALSTFLDILFEQNFSEKLNMETIKDVDKLEAIIVHIVNQRKFWRTVFQITPTGNRIRQHKCVNAVCNYLNNLARVVEQKQLTIGFLEYLEENEGILTSLLQVLTNDKTTTQWASGLKAAIQCSNSFKRRLENVRKLSEGICNDLLYTVSSNVSDFKDIKDALQFLWDSQDTVSLDQTSESTYWDRLYSLLPMATELAPLANSIMFLNVSRLLIEGKLSDFDKWLSQSKERTSLLVAKRAFKQEQEHTKHISELEEPTDAGRYVANTYVDFIKLLSSSCLPHFRQFADLMFTCDLGIPVEVMKNFIIGIDSPEILENELKLLATFATIKVPIGAAAQTKRQEMKAAIESLITLEILQQRALQLQLLFQIFDIKTQDEQIHRSLRTIGQLTNPDPCNSLSLGELHQAIKKVNNVKQNFTDDEWGIVEELVKGKELLRFLRGVIDEDLTVLIDAVEERSEEYVNASTVSDLIEVKSYIKPLLKLGPPNYAQKLVDGIVANRTRVKNGNMFKKINTCISNVHSLADLYNNVANRGELTKDTIQNALERGSYQFTLTKQDDECAVQLSYKRDKDDKEIARYGLSELNDLRSRALLILHSQKQTSAMQSHGHDDDRHHSSVSTQDLQNFIDSVNAVNDILQFCKWLVDAGHFQFAEFKNRCQTLVELQDTRKQLQQKTDEWQHNLEEARKRYYYLNFFHSKQLRLLDDFFNNDLPISNELKLLFHFVNGDVHVDGTLRRLHSLSSQSTNKTKLLDLGRTLDRIFHKKPLIKRPIPALSETPNRNRDAMVHSGTVFVAELNKRSTKSVQVLLSLYLNTTGFLPEPSQVVFCHADTSWEEVYLLIQRCEHASHHMKDQQLYVIVNADRLSTEIQFELVGKIREMQTRKDGKHHLALICRGSTSHIIDQFSPVYTHTLHGITEQELENCFKAGWSDSTQNVKECGPGVTKVVFLTSSQAGLGKTEYVKIEASKVRCGVSTMLVSGPITKDGLIQQLKCISGKRYSILHVDCAQMTDVSLFDSFIFEVVVIGMAVSGTLMCTSPSSRIILEIANTQQDVLKNSFQVCSSFEKEYIQWGDFKNFVVSQDINSPVQVTCKYLQLLEDKIDAVDIDLTGNKMTSSLGSNECRTILKRHFGMEPGLSFTRVETFLNIFAQELRRMSSSLYFKTKNLKMMVGSGSKVRSGFVRALMEVSKSFSSRSVRHVSSMPVSSQYAMTSFIESRASLQVSAEDKVARVQGMIKWHDSNHLFAGFHRQDSQTVTAVYRSLSAVPVDIQVLFKTQIKRELKDYKDMTHEELQTELEKICRKSKDPFNKDRLDELKTNYALTPDNFLKMVLIFLRVQSLIPVIIMGETGCGKTTLITYLARVCGVLFKKLNLHAGIGERDIEEYVLPLIEEAENKPHDDIWGFLDEINTCDHLGLLNEVICHRRFKGRQLPFNLTFVAACNPYRLRQGDKRINGLCPKEETRDEQAKLVYRVHELPETMMDYVWDYGALDQNDEKTYIRRMLGTKRDPVFADMIIESQSFIREVEGNSHCVSLRDVKRCDHLEGVFKSMFKSGHKQVVQIAVKVSRGCTALLNTENVRCMILALCHCYHSRLTVNTHRKVYRSKIASIFNNHKISTTPIDETHVKKIIQLEQMDFLKRMQLPKGTAKNEALRENVFVILISILSRIPVFVVGKPGCSKSLSMRLIRSNLRGEDSSDPLFKTLPAVYVISYQGSESSTSDGIIKVFEKASNYEKHNPKTKVRPVVLLDEIGLAEKSKSNPLKVLHSYLEPKMGDFPAFAVVGISNWALDSAKMNRAVHLSRPEPSKEDLSLTAKSIRDDAAAPKRLRTSMSTSDDTSSYQDKTLQKRPSIITNDYLKCLADAYVDYMKQQKVENFHGLRDYYCLVKYIAIHAARPDVTEPGDIIEKGLMRNFSGSKMGMNDIMNIFSDKVKFIQRPTSRPTVMDLIKENITDTDARHLMLITSGDAALSVLEQSLQNHKYRTIFGSRLEDDISEEYNYRMLSEIILCMESGLILIMRDLENIYGSLYDMLNQNYVEIGKKQICRVALGPNSNPMCEIHPQFRCIVLLDEKEVGKADPPFLNRFEKQALKFSEILSRPQKEAINLLKTWVNLFAKGEQFRSEETLLGYHDDTLRSLVYWRSSKAPNEDYGKLVERCKDDLIRIASPDAVLRLSRSKIYKRQSDEVEKIQRKYFDLPIHRGLMHFLNSQECQFGKFVIYTHSSFHINIRECLQGLEETQTQTHKLSYFKAERDLSNAIQDFWSSKKSVLVVQCILALDAPNMLLLKTRIDQICNQHLKERGQDQPITPKYVCIIVHLDRVQKADRSHHSWQFNFLSGWDQFAIDSLDADEPVLEYLLSRPISSIFNSAHLNWDRVILENLLWCFSCIKYSDESRSVKSALRVAGPILKTSYLMEHLKTQISKYLHFKENPSRKCLVDPDGWHTEVACDKGLLVRSSTLTGALLEHIKHCVRIPLAKVVIFLEKQCAWPDIPSSTVEGRKTDVVLDDNQSLWQLWQVCFNDNAVFNIQANNIGNPRGGETCQIDGRQVNFMFPFFLAFYRMVEKQKDWLLRSRYETLHSTFHDNSTFEHSIGPQVADLIKRIPSLSNQRVLDIHKEKYCTDLCNIFALTYAPNMDEQTRIKVTKFLLKLHEPKIDTLEDPYEYIAKHHVTIWLWRNVLAAELQLISIDSITVEKIIALMDGIDSASRVQGYTLPETKSFITPNEESYATICEDHDPHKTTERDDTDISEGKKEDTEEDKLVCDAHELTGDVAIIDKDGLESEEEETFETKLVTEICKSALPTNLTRFGGVTQWHQKCNLVLLHAGRVTIEPSILHFLRLCRDFANLSMEFKLPIAPSRVEALALLAAEGDFKDVLDDPRIFEFVSKEIKTLSDQMKINRSDIHTLQVFKCMYYNLCLEANLDTPLLEKMIRSLCTESGDLLKGSRPVLLNIIQNDIICEGDVLPVCKDVIFTSKVDASKFPNLDLLDNILADVDVESQLCVACSDIISEVAFQNITVEQIQNLDSEHSTLLETSKKAVEIVFQGDDKKPRERKGSIRYVSASSFLRSFIKVTADFLCLKRTRSSVKQGKYRAVGAAIDEILQTSCKRSEHGDLSSLTIFLCKSMRLKISLFELKAWCEDVPINSLRALAEMKWETVFYTSRLGYNPISYSVHYKETTEILATGLKTHDRPKLEDLINKTKSSQDHAGRRLGICAVLAEIYYFSKSVRSIAVSDREERSWLQQKLSALFPRELHHFLNCLIGKSKLEGLLDLSERTSDRHLQTISIIIHLACIDAASDQAYTKRLLMKSQSQMHIAWNHSSTKGIRRLKDMESMARSDCKCGLSIVYRQSEGKILKCPTCHEPVTLSNHISSTELKEPKAMSVQETISSIIHSSCYIVKSMYNKPIPVLPGAAKRVSDSSEQNKISSSSENEVHFRNVHRRLESLRSTLDESNEGIVTLIHTVLQTIQRSGSVKDDFLMQAISEVIQDINGNRKQYKKECLIAQCQTRQCLEYSLDELDKLSDYSDQERSLLHPRLFRIVHRPSFNHFQSQFNLEMTDKEFSFQFLRLFLLRREAIRLVKLLPIFLNWHTLIWQKLGNVITRKKAKTMNVSTMLRKETEGHFKGRVSATLSDAFGTFQKAWNDICDNWQTLTGNPSQFETMSPDHPISSFLMDANEEICSLCRIIEVLQRVQNDFLQQTLCLSGNNCSSSLNFMLKGIGIAGIQHVSLDEATSEIINFEWSNDMLDNSDISCECGEGSIITYNFIIIERELAKELLMNKAILTDGTVFAPFTFTGEIANIVSHMLTSIPAQVNQKDLSDEIKSTIENKDITFICDLMEHLEVILVLLKKTGGDAEDSLESYTQRWNSQLPRSFPNTILPEPRNSIKLCHVVNLFKTLEDHYADRFVESLPKALREPIPEADKETLSQRLQDLEVDEMGNILTFLRRFVFRCLRNSGSLDEDTIRSKLVEVIGRAGMDDEHTSGLNTLLADTQGICTRHVFKTQEFIHQHLQSKKQGEEGVAFSSLTEPPSLDVQGDRQPARSRPSVVLTPRNKPGRGKRQGGLKSSQRI